MTGTTADKIKTMLARSRQAIDMARQKRQALPEGFLDKIAGISIQFIRENLKNGNAAEARAVLASALELLPDHPEFCMEQANLLIKAGEMREALPFLDRTLAAQPGNARAHHLKGYALMTLWRLPEALPHFGKAAELQPDVLQYHTGYAEALSSAGHPREAAAIWERLLEQSPDTLDFMFSLAARLNDAGEFERARDLYRRILRHSPQNGLAHRMLSRTTKYKPGDPHIAEIEAAYAKVRADTTDQHRADHERELHFALYNVYNDIGSHAEAFDHLTQANRLLGESKGYSDGSELLLIRKIKAYFSREFVATMPSSGSDEMPIFIVGMPRSGSTLTEQILGAHPDVGGAGEVYILQDIIGREFYDHRTDKLKSDPQAFSRKRLDAAAADYIETLRGVSSPGRRLTDKYLSNFLWVGMIRMLFPKAKIIHCRRNPLANCFSIYSNYFATTGMKYKARLEDIGRYYLAHDGLMRHWRTLFPGFVHELVYEDLTTDQEEQTRRLLDYCELDWNPACLKFHESAQSVKTASFHQVRQAMYSGVDRKTAHYLEWLGPLIDILDMDGQRAGATSTGA